MVAAATTSLPERAEQGRNYDYRYCWIRDQCYAGQAVAAAGAHPLLDEAVRYVSERVLADGPELRPAYSAAGETIPEEADLDLPGYPGASAKVGNWVTHQFQLDAYGEALLLFAAAARLDRLEPIHWRAVQVAVSAIEQRWRQPDAGIWELHNSVGRIPG
jgi:alpha,alpha-trehalase